jgi:hypothetical protein
MPPSLLLIPIAAVARRHQLDDVGINRDPKVAHRVATGLAFTAFGV